MYVRFWGTRGSIAKPGPGTLRYGGNTSCVEVRADDGTLVVLDCGTGAHELSCHLRDQPTGPLRGHLLISHTHWDHIQGFPFFEPLFQSGQEWHVYAPGGRREQLEAALSAQMSYTYHPVTLEALAARVQFHDLTEGEFDADGVRVRCQYLHHPALTLGYRLEADGASVVYATDHEPHALLPGSGAGQPPIHHEDQRHVRFLEGADLVIHDAQYTLDEFPEKRGWGHTPAERALDYAAFAGARRLALFHHDPERDDAALDAVVAQVQRRAVCAGAEIEVFAAAEGQVVSLAGPQASRAVPVTADRSAVLAAGVVRVATVLIVEDDPVTSSALRAALQPEGLRVLEARDGETALAMVRRENPSLVLLDMDLPQLDGTAVCRALRASEEPRARHIPVLALTDRPPSESRLNQIFIAGATDFLSKPVKPTLLRSRVSGWLLRTRPA